MMAMPVFGVDIGFEAFGGEMERVGGCLCDEYLLFWVYNDE